MNLDISILNNLYNLENQPSSFFEGVEKIFQQHISLVFLTYLVITQDQKKVRRIYTNEQKFPVGGYKNLDEGEWKDTVVYQKKSIYLKDKKAIKDEFEDFELIFSLGVGSCLNVPILFENQTIGTVNICAKENAYLDKDIKNAQAITGLLAPLVALENQKFYKGELQ